MPVPSSSMPAPSPRQRRAETIPAPKPAPKPEPEYDDEDVFSDDPEYDQLEGEDAEFESVSFEEQSLLDEQYETQSEAEQIDFDAEEYEVEDETPAPQKPRRQSAMKNPPGSAKSLSDRKRESKPLRERKSVSEDERAQRRLDALNEPNPKDNPRPNFVNEKKKELEPFGGKKSGKAYISDVDRRANLRKKATFVQFGVLGLLALTVGFGFKNAIFPAPTLSNEEVVQIIDDQTGNTGFPSQRGEGFATDFMSAWAQRDDSPIRAAALANFYGGEEATDGETMLELGEFRQEVVYGPTVYEVNPISLWSENYIIGVGVSVSDTMTGVPLEIGEEGEPNIQWRYFSVDVYWDNEADTMAITPGSPSLVPPYEIAGRSEMPPATMPGSGAEDAALTEASRTTVEGFMSGYVNASSENTSPIDQYITEGIEPDPVYLTKGMDNAVELDGEVSDAVTHTVYRIDAEDDSYVAAVVNVRWRDSSAGGEETGVTYQSTYNMRLMQEAEGRWTVTGFWPLYYVPGEE